MDENVCHCGQPGEVTLFVGDEPVQLCGYHARQAEHDGSADWGSPRPEGDHVPD